MLSIEDKILMEEGNDIERIKKGRVLKIIGGIGGKLGCEMWLEGMDRWKKRIGLDEKVKKKIVEIKIFIEWIKGGGFEFIGKIVGEFIKIEVDVKIKLEEIERESEDDVELERGIVILLWRVDREGIEGDFKSVEKRWIKIIEMNEEGVIIRGLIMVENVEKIGVRDKFWIEIEDREKVVRFNVGEVMKFEEIEKIEGKSIEVLDEEIDLRENCRGIIIRVDCEKEIIDMMGDLKLKKRVENMRVKCEGEGIDGIKKCEELFRSLRKRGGWEKSSRKKDGIEKGENCNDLIKDLCVKMDE